MIVLDVPAAPYVEEHVLTAIQTLGRIADEVDDDLQHRFGGQSGLGSTMTGGYL